ncbi:MAG TPA: hypothetical protein VFG10_18930 [Saprospiraceae bacterium]|nr:hypothetical protein [Saprospiraceae bacterium]
MRKKPRNKMEGDEEGENKSGENNGANTTVTADRKYTYKGPQYGEGHLLHGRKELRPAEMNDAEVAACIARYPELARWWLVDYTE